MKVLLLGGNGFVGRGICQTLSERGHDITSLDLPELDLAVDQENFDKWLENYEGVRFDAIVNCVGINGAQASYDDPGKFYQVNGFSAIYLKQMVERFKSRTILHISSETVLGSGTDLIENSPLLPGHPYAFSKSIFEAYIISSTVFKGINSVILRFPIICGEGSPIDSALDLIRKDFENRSSVVLFGDGTHRRKFISIHDVGPVAEIAVKLNGQGVTVLHAPGTVYSMLDVYQKYSAKYALHPKIIFKDPKSISQIASLWSRTSEVYSNLVLTSVI